MPSLLAHLDRSMRYCDHCLIRDINEIVIGVSSSYFVFFFALLFECKPIHSMVDMVYFGYYLNCIDAKQTETATPLSNFILARYTQHNCCVTARI